MRCVDTRWATLFILIAGLVAGPAGGEEKGGDPARPAAPGPARPAAPDPAAPGPAAVKAAIRRGVEYLKGEQAGDGSWDRDAGSTGLVLFALAHSGVKPGDRTLDRGVRWLLANLGRPDTYGASLAVMALATIDRELYRRQISSLARLIEHGQCKNGQWTYHLRGGRSSGDNSNTQFAALALWYARGAGRTTKAEVYAACRKFFTESQNEDGGWGYSAKERTKSYGSMVATGLAVLAICRAGEKNLALADPAVAKGKSAVRAVAWLAEHFAADANPEAEFKLGKGMRGVAKRITDSYWRYYWLWSVERAATIAGIERFGETDWYVSGARALLDGQRDDGSWVGSEAPVFATSFALLFLTRSTRRAVATEPHLAKAETTPAPR